MYKGKRVSVVVPALNEEKLIGLTLGTMPDYLDYIIVVNDGSVDSTKSIVEQYMGDDPRIILINHTTNGGVGAAIISGYRKSIELGVDAVAVMAGDYQMDPVYLPRLLDPVIEGRVDYAKGNRLLSEEYRRGMSRWRYLGNSILTLLTKIASGYWQIMDPQNGYTVISRDALEAVNWDQVFTYYGYCNDILIKLNIQGFKILDVPIPAKYGDESSKIKYISYILRVSRMLFSGFFYRLKMKYIILSFHPLVFFYAMGLIITPLSIIFMAYSIYYKFVLGRDLFIRLALSMLLFLIGTQFTFFAMLYDMQNEKK